MGSTLLSAAGANRVGGWPRICHAEDVRTISIVGGLMADLVEEVDFALAAFREEGVWQLQEIASPAYESVEALSHALRRLPGDGGAVGMVAVDEDFFLVVRVAGATTRVLLSDVTAADEWEIAQSAIDFLGLPPAEDDDEQVPAGDLDLLADLGINAIDLAVLLDDEDDLYPDEILSEVARRLGFGELFDDHVGLTSA
jgi:putative tRNA adenosine deaminase-associated protein